jgi:hypothetical protein
MGRGAAGDRWRRGGVGWTDGHDDTGRKRRSKHRGTQIGRADKIARRATRAGVGGGRRSSVWTS